MTKIILMVLFAFSSWAAAEEFKIPANCPVYKLNTADKKWHPVDRDSVENKSYTVKKRNTKADLVYFAANGAWHAVKSPCAVATNKVSASKISYYVLGGYQTTPLTLTDEFDYSVAMTETWTGLIAGAQFPLWESNAMMFSVKADAGLGQANVTVDTDQTNLIQYKYSNPTTMFVRVLPQLGFHISSSVDLFAEAGGSLRYGKYEVPPGYKELPGSDFFVTYGLGISFRLTSFSLILEGGAVKDTKHYFANAGVGFSL